MDHVDDMCKPADSQEQPSPNKGMTFDKATLKWENQHNYCLIVQKLQGSGPLMLTEEEKRTLVAEGYPIPNKLPLTKSEEKALKRVRRKIKNKVNLKISVKQINYQWDKLLRK